MLPSEEFWDDIQAHLRQRILVTVVGPELLVIPDGARTITLTRLIAERLVEKYRLAIDLTDRTRLNDVVRTFLGSRERSEGQRLYRIVNDILSEIQAPSPEPLQQLAAIADARMFVSTTFDSMLRRALDEVRHGNTPRTRELWFAPNQDTAAQEKNARPPAEDETVVLKIFGQAASTPQYALHDEDMLEWLHALLTETARLPEWLDYRLKEQPVLFVGCQIPDWLGRSFIRMASRTRLSLATKQFFIVDRRPASESPLAEFFRAYCGAACVQVFDMDPRQFVGELLRRWRERNPETAASAAAAAAPAPPAVRGSIFISYAREDVAAARSLHAAIQNLGGDVWLDERRLKPGDEWEREILAGIRREVRLFIPLISRNTERREEGYVFKEWKEAGERATGIPSRRFVVPVVIDEDYHGDLAGYRNLPEDFSRKHFGRAPGGEPDPDLVDTLKEEIRAMRRRTTA
jgi:hypothetical protein